ncbi:MAG: ABC transporter substrate-binding protein [Clostridiales bacterium]|jgi:sulfonate transport system substrate-binding protein|nr:ABC transporter substrate-binding protein [Clostridiales bacterium]
MKKHIVRHFFAFTLTIVLAFTATACAATENTSEAPPAEMKEVRIGFPSAGGDWPGNILGVAAENGYLDEYLNALGYKASLNGFVGAAPAIHEALVAKELDYVVYAGMAADLSKTNGIEHTLLSITGWGSSWKFIVREGAGIETLADLKGKKIAYTRGASPHMYVIRVLNEAGLTFDDIEPINSTLPEGIAGIVSGTIDATVVVSGQEGELVNTGSAKVMHNGFASDRATYYEPSVFIARTEAYQENKDVAVAIQKALLKAKDWAQADPDRFFKLQADRSGYPLEVVLATAEYDLNISTPLNLDKLYIDSLKSIETFLRDNELITGSIDFDTWVDDYVVTTAKKEYDSEK